MSNFSAFYQNICTYDFSNRYSARLWSRFKPAEYDSTKYTPQQLDERRKCEILKYKKNASNMTKKEQFAAAARGTLLPKRGFAIQTDTTTNPNIAGLEQVGNLFICPQRVNRCSSTTDCDIPGRPITLCYDPEVPLYNYARTYEYKAGQVIGSRIPTMALTAPTNLALVGGNAQMIATWGPPETDAVGTYGGAALSGYRVAYSLDRQNWTSVTPANTNTPATTITIAGLLNNSLYYVKVDSVNALDKMSAFPAIMSAPTFLVPTKPLSVTAIGDDTPASGDNTAIIIKWAPPLSNGGTPITAYQIEYSSDRVSWVLVSGSAISISNFDYNVTTSTYSYRFAGTIINPILTKTVYYVRISAKNLVTDPPYNIASPYAQIVTVSTLAEPNNVTNVYAIAGTQTNQVVLNWDNPVSTGGSSIKSYKISYYKPSDPTNVTIVATTTDTTYTVIGLTQGTNYTFTIKAFNGTYESTGYSISARTNTVPGMPVGLKATVVNGQIILSFIITDNGGSAITKYIVSLMTTDDVWTAYTYPNTSTSSTGPIVINLMTTLLTNGSRIPSTDILTKITYYFRVVAYNALYPTDAGITTNYDVSAIIIVAPQKPTGLTLLNDPIVKTKLHMSWTAPTDTGGDTRIGYIIQYSTMIGDANTSKIWIFYNAISNPINALSTTATNLRPETNYFFRIYAVNSFGMISDASIISNISIPKI